MIKSFKHKGLERFFVSGSTAGIQPVHATRISDCLAFLHAAKIIEDMDRPGYRFHQLTGDHSGLWAVDVSRNWRIVFMFANEGAYFVNYEDQK